MGTWIKETDNAIYLMQGNTWLSRITKYPSTSNPQEQTIDVTGMEAWFLRPDAPSAMTIALGTGAPEPEQWVAPPPPPPPPPSANSGKTNDAGIEIIKSFEGLRTTAYQDAVGVWTIGYGHTSMAGSPTVYAGMTITTAEAETILRQDLNVFEAGVTQAVTTTTTSDQFSAMVSFSFNVGLGAYQDSTLLKKHNGRDFAGAADEFLRWVYAGGEVLPGLERRRKAERALYLSQDYSQYL